MMRKIVNVALPVLLCGLLAAAFFWIALLQGQLQEQQALCREITLLTRQQQTLQEQQEQMQMRLEEAETQTQELLDQLQMQQDLLQQLQGTVERLVQASQGKLGEGGDFVMRCSPETFDYLAIGNSITTHDVCDYWPNVSGMAASVPEKDYFHLVSSGLAGTVNSYACSLFAWEVIPTDRAEMATLTDRYLTEDLDLVTVQLGENAKDLSTFQEDFAELIRHIQKLAPNAEILVLGDFWNYENRNSLKKQAAEQCGVSFVALDAIADDPSYQAGPVVKVTDRYGQVHEIRHAGVAMHPSDEAMAHIAQAVLEAKREMD